MSAVSDILMAPDVRPFAVAAAIMAALGAVELLTTLVGFSISGVGADDVAVETDSHDALGGLFLWIKAGRFPLLILIIRATSRGISRIIPRDETYAVSDADFVGKVATVSIGPLDQGLPGRVRLKDVFGNWHTVAARASPDSQALAVGASVLLVDRDARSFVAIAAPADLIA